MIVYPLTFYLFIHYSCNDDNITIIIIYYSKIIWKINYMQPNTRLMEINMDSVCKEFWVDQIFVMLLNNV